MKPLVISPPFGNYIDVDWATSVAGTYTVKRRHGLIWNTIKSLRPTRYGWVNNIGLKNPGIDNVKFNKNKIYSVAGFDDEEWNYLADSMPKGLMVELNIGCPNVAGVEYFPKAKTIKKYLKKFKLVIMKFPPTARCKMLMAMAYSYGIRSFHLCNTIPTGRGGESGRRLFNRSHAMVEFAKEHYGKKVFIIAGGGIYKPHDVYSYRRVGANAFSISTVFFKPWRILSIKRAILIASDENYGYERT